MKNLLLAAVVIVFSACNPKYYVPNTQNAPLLTKRGEFVGVLASNGNQHEAQLALGVTKHLGVQINGGIFRPKDEKNGNGGSGYFGELGMGYFASLGKTIVFETYVLAGFGGVENHLPTTVDSMKSTAGKINVNLSRFAFQPGIGYKGRNFSFVISSRFSSLNFSKPTGSLIYNKEDQIEYLKKNSSMILAEPALSLRFGYKNFKVQLQYGLSINLSNKDFLQDKNFLTLGLMFRIPGKL